MYRKMIRWKSLEDSYLVEGSDTALQFLLCLAFPVGETFIQIDCKPLESKEWPGLITVNPLVPNRRLSTWKELSRLLQTLLCHLGEGAQGKGGLTGFYRPSVHKEKVGLQETALVAIRRLGAFPSLLCGHQAGADSAAPRTAHFCSPYLPV